MQSECSDTDSSDDEDEQLLSVEERAARTIQHLAREFIWIRYRAAAFIQVFARVYLKTRRRSAIVIQHAARERLLVDRHRQLNWGTAPPPCSDSVETFLTAASSQLRMENNSACDKQQEAPTPMMDFTFIEQSDGSMMCKYSPRYLGRSFFNSHRPESVAARNSREASVSDISVSAPQSFPAAPPQSSRKPSPEKQLSTNESNPLVSTDLFDAKRMDRLALLTKSQKYTALQIRRRKNLKTQAETLAQTARQQRLKDRERSQKVKLARGTKGLPRRSTRGHSIAKDRVVQLAKKSQVSSSVSAMNDRPATPPESDDVPVVEERVLVRKASLSVHSDHVADSEKKEGGGEEDEEDEGEEEDEEDEEGVDLDEQAEADYNDFKEREARSPHSFYHNAQVTEKATTLTASPTPAAAQKFASAVPVVTPQEEQEDAEWSENEAEEERSAHGEHIGRVAKSRFFGTRRTQRALALSTGLDAVPEFASLSLRDSRLGDQSVMKLLPTLSKSLTFLDLSANKIRAGGCSAIRDMLVAPECKLRSLKLDSNGLTDAPLAVVCAALQKNSSLSELSLEHNSIGTRSLEALAAALAGGSPPLRTLSLKWNPLRGKAGAQLLQAASSHRDLKWLNLAFSSMGSTLGQDRQRRVVVSALCALIEQNSILDHLDLSHNQFSHADCVNISESLDRNHTLFGLHFDGNPAAVDNRGFLVVDDDALDNANVETADTATATVVGERLSAAAVVKKQKVFSSLGERRMATCWMCKNWVEMEFRWTARSGLSLDDLDCNAEPVVIHLSLDGWHGETMHFDEASRSFVVFRMVPREPIWFYFTHPCRPGVLLCAKDQLSEMCPRLGPGNVRNVAEVDACCRKTGCNGKIDFECRRAKPRLLVATGAAVAGGGGKGAAANLPASPSIKTDAACWSLATCEIFAPRAKETASHSLVDNAFVYERAFEVDFRKSNIGEIVEDPGAFHKIKALLRVHYPLIVRVFKRAVRVQGEKTTPNRQENLSAVGPKAFVAFCASSGVLDARRCIESVFAQIGGTTAGGHCIVRHQMLELLVRLALVTYGGDGKLVADEAVEDFLRNHVTLRHCDDARCVDVNEWRREALYCEEVAKVFGLHRACLRTVFDAYASAEFRGQKYMPLKDFRRVLRAAQFIDDDGDGDGDGDGDKQRRRRRSTRRHSKDGKGDSDGDQQRRRRGSTRRSKANNTVVNVVACFADSKLLAVDDEAAHASSSRKYLTFADFLEAFSRVVAQKALPPYDGPYVVSDERELHEKLHVALPIFIGTLRHSSKRLRGKLAESLDGEEGSHSGSGGAQQQKTKKKKPESAAAATTTKRLAGHRNRGQRWMKPSVSLDSLENIAAAVIKAQRPTRRRAAQK